MLLELTLLYEEEEKGEDKTEEFKRALLMSFPSEKVLKKLFGKVEEEEVWEIPLDSEEVFEIEAILSRLNTGNDSNIPLVEQEA